MLVRIKKVTENAFQTDPKDKEIWGDLRYLYISGSHMELSCADGSKRVRKTSMITEVTISGDSITVYTMNSIYRLEVVREP